MIFHASIPADDPERVARVLGEVLCGGYNPFHVGRQSFMAWGPAEHGAGTGIEVYHRDEVMMPGKGEDGMVELGHLDNPPKYGCFHLAIGTKLPKEKIIAIGKREGWRAVHCNRGRFDVVEFWVENSLMIEFFDPPMQDRYTALVSGRVRSREAAAPAG